MTPRLPSCSTAEIKKPKNKEEERQLKKGHVEDDNTDIAYFDFGLFYPSLIAFITAIISLFFALLLSLEEPFPHPSAEESAYFIKFYGQYVFNCSTTTPPIGSMYSLLNLFDGEVHSNIIFRLVTAYPMAVRLFNSMIFRMKASQEMPPKTSVIQRFVNEISPTVTLLEVTSLALFSIITSHSDSDLLNLLSKKIFAASSATNMVTSTLVVFTLVNRADSIIDLFSIFIKMMCCLTYCAVISQIFFDPAREVQPCYALVPRENAIKEYIAIVAYLSYQASTIIDVRNMRFACYPRTCSGECEPVDPMNFAKGQKYEHCRSWEYNQHHQKSITHININ